MEQWKIVLEHLKSGKTITSMEAIQQYGFTRLSSIIHTLRNYGYDIETKMVKVPTRYGKDTLVAMYSLVSEDDE